MTISDADTVSYVIVVRGVPEPAYAKFAKQFPKHRGGVNPRTRETYHAVECDLSDVCKNLEWIETNLSEHYTNITLGVSIYTARNWSNFDVPDEILQATQKYNIALRLMFSSPATRSADTSDA